MIIGLVGPVVEDIIEVKDLLLSDKSIQYVDSVDVIRNMDRKSVNSLTTKAYHKQYFLRKLEDVCGTIVVTGNLLLTEDVCNWILSNGGLIVVVSREFLEDYEQSILNSTELYWGEPVTQKYNLETRFKELYNQLKKSNSGVDNLFLVDVSKESCDDLYELTESCEDWPSSEKILTEQKIVSTVTLKEDEHMKLEDSIKKAMKELGMETEDLNGLSCEDTVEDTVSDKDLEDTTQAEETQSSTENKNVAESIFVKISEGTMALLLPEDLVLEKQTIGDMVFNVATVEIPDVSNHKLQELEVKLLSNPDSKKVEKKQEKDTKTPVKNNKSKKVETEKPKSVEQSMKVVVVSGDLSDLNNEKSRLDAEIKKFRDVGDVETVNALRKQRRAVRNKINNLKKSQ